MKYILSIHESAELEIDDAIRFYDLRNAKLGDWLIQDIKDSINSIKAYPESFPIIT